jgi:iron(III) transport system ATP-binding protein
MLELVGMVDSASARPSQLSGGQQQRVALARALAPRPALLLLDEPFASLDATTRSQVRDEVFEMVRQAGATAVLVTHDQQEALSVADTVAVLLDGRIAQHSTPAGLYHQPATLDLAMFVGEAVVLPGRLRGATVTTALGVAATTSPLPDGDVTVVVRPEHLALRDPLAPLADGAHVAGRVVSRSFFGHDGMVRVRLDHGMEVTCRTSAHHLPERGSLVQVEIDGPVLVFPSVTGA